LVGRWQGIWGSGPDVMVGEGTQGPYIGNLGEKKRVFVGRVCKVAFRIYEEKESFLVEKGDNGILYKGARRES